MTVVEGARAPEFTLTTDEGRQVSLGDYRDRRLVLYFYPAAFTPGCTTEACDFRDNYRAFEDAGYAVLGISPDPPERLAEFRADHHLPFPLASDPDNAVAEAYGAWGTKQLYGRETQGVIRSTFLIGPGGVVTLARRNVKATGHVDRLVGSL